MVSVIVRYKVNAQKHDDFTKWSTEIGLINISFPGFLSKEVIPPIGDDPRYIVILRFNRLENAESWLHSEQRLLMLQNASAQFLTNIEHTVHTKHQFWFNTVKNENKWRQLISTYVAVFPLTVIVPEFVEVLFISFPDIHWILKAMISALVICFLMVFYIMPFMIRIAEKWSSKRSHQKKLIIGLN